MCYLISHHRSFTKWNLFEILLYVTFLTMKFSNSIWYVFIITINAPITSMPHYLLPGDVREEVRISIVQNSNAPPIGHTVQSNANWPSPHQNMRIYKGICCLIDWLIDEFRLHHSDNCKPFFHGGVKQYKTHTSAATLN